MNGGSAALVSTVVGVVLTALLFMLGYLLKRLVDQLDKLTNHVDNLNTRLIVVESQMSKDKHKEKMHSGQDGNPTDTK